MPRRDVQLKLKKKFGEKKDEPQRYRAVLCASNGSRTTGSVWANQDWKLVYFQFFGSGGVGVARCQKIEPQLGLGVYVGKTDDGLEWQVLEDDAFLRRTATDARGYQSISARDFEPGGRLQLWLYTKLIVPLATYPTPGSLKINVVAGDYPHTGTRKTFSGATNVDLSASVPAAGLWRYVGIYLDSSNTLQTVDGTASSTASDPAEPSWPAGAFRLSVVRLANGQTSISFADDIQDRRMAWGDENGGNVWPLPGKLNIGATEYSTLALAIAAAVSGDTIYVGTGTFTCDNLTLPSGVNLVGGDRDNTIIQTTTSTICLQAAGSNYISNLSIKCNVNAALANALSILGNVELNNVLIEATNAHATGPATAVSMTGGTVQGGFNCTIRASTSGTGNALGVDANTSLSFRLQTGEIDAETYALAIVSGATVVLEDVHITSGTFNNSGTLKGWYYDANGNLISFSDTKLTLGNGAVTPPLNVTARSATPSAPATGDIYLDDGTNTPSGNKNLLHYNGASWDELGDGGGSTGAQNFQLYHLGAATEYATLALAVAAAVSGDTILVYPGAYTTNDVTLPDGVNLIVLDPENTTFSTSTSQYCIRTGAGSYLLNVRAQVTTSHATQVGAIYLAGNNSICENCTAIGSNSHASGFGYGFYQTGATGVELRNCYGDGTATTAADNYGYRMDTSAGSCTIVGGKYLGDAHGIYNDSGTLTLVNPVINVIGGSVGGGTFRGEAFDIYGRKLRVKPEGVANVRLTLTSGTPVTTGDVTAATTIYATPYKGNRIEVYDGSLFWIDAPFAELSLSLSGFTADKNSDLWVYDNAGTLALERTEWTNDTTRATALAVQDGRYVKNGTTTRFYLGTFRTTGTTGQCEDSISKRFVWNYYNRISRYLLHTENTTHTYNGAAWREWNNATNRVYFVVGVAEDMLIADNVTYAQNGAAGGQAQSGLALDTVATSTLTPGAAVYDITYITQAAATPMTVAGVGYHYLAAMEYGAGTPAPSFYVIFVNVEVLG